MTTPVHFATPHTALRRLRNPVTNRYLHLSGEAECTTTGTAYAWSGTHAQALELKRRWNARGREFPFVLTGMAAPKTAQAAEYL